MSFEFKIESNEESHKQCAFSSIFLVMLRGLMCLRNLKFNHQSIASQNHTFFPSFPFL